MPPTFCFTTREGETFERIYSMTDDIPHSISLGNGRYAFRDLSAEHPGPRGKRVRGVKIFPRKSLALGVNPSQRQEAYEASVQAGVPTTFDKWGDAEIRSAKHEKDYGRTRGIYRE